MTISATIEEGCSSRIISMEMPMFCHPLLPNSYVDPRWARPYVFHDITRYPFSEINDVQKDFQSLVSYVNTSFEITKIKKYKDGLLKIVDAHILKYGRIIFCDLLLYVDCLANLCYASDLMTESQIKKEYASWVKFVVDSKMHSIMSSTMWGPMKYLGSDNERDLKSCF